MNRLRLIDSLHQYDQRLLWYFVHSPRRRLWLASARTLSRSGDGIMQVLLPLCLWWVDRDRGGDLAYATALAFAVERPLYWVLKNCCRRRRPPDAIPAFEAVIHASDRFSFPSGHTMAAFLFATLAVMSYGAIFAPLYVWAFGVGLSRVALGVHFPSDILAGAGLGIGLAYLLWPF